MRFKTSLSYLFNLYSYATNQLLYTLIQLLTWQRWDAQMFPGASVQPPHGWWRVAFPPHLSGPAPSSMQRNVLRSSSPVPWIPSHMLLHQSQLHIHTVDQLESCFPYPWWHCLLSSSACLVLLQVLWLCSGSQITNQHCCHWNKLSKPFTDGPFGRTGFLHPSRAVVMPPNEPFCLANGNYFIVFGIIVSVKLIRSKENKNQKENIISIRSVSPLASIIVNSVIKHFICTLFNIIYEQRFNNLKACMPLNEHLMQRNGSNDTEYGVSWKVP